MIPLNPRQSDPTAQPTNVICKASRQTRYYQIGMVAVSLTSDRSEVLDDFHALYGRYQIPPTTVRVAIQVRTARSRSFRRYSRIYANGEEMFVISRPSSILPHVEWAINAAIARRMPGFIQLHAAVLSRDGIGLILPGTPGQGKTTTAAALLQRGWSYLSDEFAMIDPATGLLHAYPKALCIKAGSFDLLAEFGLPIDRLNVKHKGIKGRVVMLDPHLVRPQAVSPPCPVGMIVLPRYGNGQPPRIEPISRARVLYELTQVCFNFNKFLHHGVAALAEMVRQTRCYQLTTGDLAETCRLIESRLHGSIGWREAV